MSSVELVVLAVGLTGIIVAAVAVTIVMVIATGGGHGAIR